MQPVSAQRSTDTKNTSTAKPGRKNTVEEEGHAKLEHKLDDKQATKLFSRQKKQSSFEDRHSFQRMTSERIVVDYHGKNGTVVTVLVRISASTHDTRPPSRL